MRMRADGRPVLLTGSALDEALARAGLAPSGGGAMTGVGLGSPLPSGQLGGPLHKSPLPRGTPPPAGASSGGPMRSQSPVTHLDASHLAGAGGAHQGALAGTAEGTQGPPAAQGSLVERIAASLAAQQGLRKAQHVATPPHAPPYLRAGSGAGGCAASAAPACSTPSMSPAGRMLRGDPGSGMGTGVGSSSALQRSGRGQPALQAAHGGAGMHPQLHAAPPPQRAGPPRGPQAPARGAPPPSLPAQAQWQQPAQAAYQWGAPQPPPPPLLPASAEQLAALQQGLAMGGCAGADPYATGAYAGPHSGPHAPGGMPDWLAQYQLVAAMAQAAPQHAVSYVGGGYAPEGFPGVHYAEDAGLGDGGYGGPMGGQLPGGGWG